MYYEEREEEEEEEGEVGEEARRTSERKRGKDALREIEC